MSLRIEPPHIELVSRRRVLGAAGAAVAASALPAASFADTWPSRPVRAIIPWPAGGPTDVVSRMLMTRLSTRLGQPIVIDNRPGGNGIIGLAAAAKSPADGYSLLIADIGSSTILPALRRDLPYDTLRDFAPVSLMVSASVVLFVRDSLPVRSLAELIAYAKASPGKLNYGSVGQGSSFHLATELLKARAGIDMKHVPYKGGPPLITDFMAGRIDVSFLSTASVPQAIRAGSNLRPLAVSTQKRNPMLPNLPTIAETLPGYDVSTWFGLLAPTGTPRPIVDRLQQELAVVVKMPDIIEQMRGHGQEPEGSTPEEYGARLRRDIAQWADVVRTADIKGTE
ncbi:MAG: tripartite tricarboxylate transporter substrate binding protein [Burkholderiaceae bacterium]|nr:tripartite tricarboxylate transporter substrate binding protein [Burkholderiaceae bacterium]